MNCKAILTTAAAGAVLSVFSAVPAPEVSVSGMSQDSKGVATISYTLSAADAVVTLDIQTNATVSGETVWASIGGAAVSAATGDVWKKVEQGLRKITWDGATNWADGKIPSSGIRAVVTAWSVDNTPDYMVVDISAAAKPNTQRYYPAVDFLPGGLLGNPDYRTTSLVMRKILAKDVEWTMGSTALELQRSSNEKTHKVTLTNNYYIGVFEITGGQWGLIQTERVTPSYFNNNEYRAMRPVEQVCYNELRNAAGNSTEENPSHNWPNDPNPHSFLGLLCSKTGMKFDLPSEAQWEFAARGGNGDTKWGDGSGIRATIQDSSAEIEDSNLDNIGRYKKNAYKDGDLPPRDCEAEYGTAVVGSYAPNKYGLYDMSGNVFEFCLDWYEDEIDYEGMLNISPSDQSKMLSGNTGGARVIRGGCWYSVAAVCRPAWRGKTNANNRNSSYGFRVVCTAGLK